MFAAPEGEKKLFVGGLSWETGEEQLNEYFGQFGEVESINLKIDPHTGKSRCFAFIVFTEPESLQKCFAQTEHAINSKKVNAIHKSFGLSDAIGISSRYAMGAY